MKVALQLWSVRDDMAKDFFGTLKQVAEMGYDGVEFAGYFDHAAEDVKAALDEYGLVAAGTHTGINFDQFDQMVAYEKTLGNRNIVVPAFGMSGREELDKAVDTFRRASDMLKEHDMVLSYHNHDFEFKKLDGRYLLDLLYEEVGLDRLKAEVDVYWVYFAGEDPVEYLKKFKGNAPLVHLKDMHPTKRESTVVGEGRLDMKAVITQAQENGTEWLVVEQEEYEKPPIACVADCVKNIRRILAELV